MNGQAAGSGWWDETPDGDDDAPDGDASDQAGVEPPLDNRTTQPMPKIVRPGASPPTSPWPASPDTIRVQTPAWLLDAQSRAAEQNRSATEPEPEPEFEAEAEVDESDTASAPVPTIGHRPTAGEPDRRTRFLDPTIAASYREPRPGPDVLAGAIGLFGAAMLSIGSLSTWARSTGVAEATVTGLSGSNGWGTLACGIVVGFGAVLLLRGHRGGLVGAAMLVAALAAVYFCGFSAVDILRTGDELPEILVGVGIDRETAGVATLELTRGFAVVAAGAAAALAAGTVAFARRV